MGYGALGAEIGTAIFPGVGTLIGGFLGAAVGGFAGSTVASLIKRDPLEADATSNSNKHLIHLSNLLDKATYATVIVLTKGSDGKFNILCTHKENLYLQK